MHHCKGLPEGVQRRSRGAGSLRLRQAIEWTGQKQHVAQDAAMGGCPSVEQARGDGKAHAQKQQQGECRRNRFV